MATKTKGLDVPALVAAILDPLQVPDKVLPRLLSALGTSTREDTCELIQADAQAAQMASRIVKPLLAKVAAPIAAAKEIALPPAEAVAAGAATTKKAGVKF